MQLQGFLVCFRGNEPISLADRLEARASITKLMKGLLINDENL